MRRALFRAYESARAFLLGCIAAWIYFGKEKITTDPSVLVEAPVGGPQSPTNKSKRRKKGNGSPESSRLNPAGPVSTRLSQDALLVVGSKNTVHEQEGLSISGETKQNRRPRSASISSGSGSDSPRRNKKKKAKSAHGQVTGGSHDEKLQVKTAQHVLPSSPLRTPAQNHAAELHSGPRGIANYGNTCYIDTVLISMFAGTNLFDSTLVPAARDLTGATEVQTAVSDIIKVLRSNQLVPSQMVEDLRKLLNFSERQHDASEFLLRLLEHLNYTAVPHRETLVHNGVPERGDQKMVIEPVHAISMAGARGTDGKGLLFEELLENHLTRDKVDGLRRSVRTPTGEIMPATVSAQKQLAFVPSAPEKKSCPRSAGTIPHSQPLMFSLKRYDDYLQRVSASVKIPEELNVSGYVEGVGDGGVAQLALQSVICHHGTSMDSGHYTAYTHVDGAWWKFDSYKNPISSPCQDVAAMHLEWEANAYTLFYELKFVCPPGA